MRLCLLLMLLPFTAHSAVQTTHVSLDSIQGAWVCIYSVYDDPNLAHDEVGPWHLSTESHLLFENDSLFRLNYPCELASREKVIVRNDSIVTSKDAKAITERITGNWPARIFFEGDTLVFVTDHLWGSSTEQRYLRTKLDTHTVSWLKKFSVHLQCLHGRWKLETSYDSGYDGLGIVDYKFPFVPQHVLVFTSNSRIDYSSRILYLQADGAARPFEIVEIDPSGKYLTVQTMPSWYKGDWQYPLHYTKQ